MFKDPFLLERKRETAEGLEGREPWEARRRRDLGFELSRR